MTRFVVLPDGTRIKGQYPGEAAATLWEHHLRDVLAAQIQGATEAILPYGRADVMTKDVVFEVERAEAWRTAVRQVLAYSAQANRQPAIALFGAANPDVVLSRFLRLRDGTPPILLYWFNGHRWIWISARRYCRTMPAAHPQLALE